jgi:hypothetical protein
MRRGVILGLGLVMAGIAGLGPLTMLRAPRDIAAPGGAQAERVGATKSPAVSMPARSRPATLRGEVPRGRGPGIDFHDPEVIVARESSAAVPAAILLEAWPSWSGAEADEPPSDPEDVIRSATPGLAPEGLTPLEPPALPDPADPHEVVRMAALEPLIDESTSPERPAELDGEPDDPDEVTRRAGLDRPAVE